MNIISASINMSHFQERYQLHWAAALIVLGIIFVFIGWFCSKCSKPKIDIIQDEIHSLKKQLLDDLNDAKKFNSDYQLLAQKEIEDDKPSATKQDN